MSSILIRFGNLTLTARFNASLTAQALARVLPIESTAHRWGGELYWAAPVITAHEDATQDVQLGDLGYWVEGQSLCLFFGRTPASVDGRPRPIVPVNLVGRCMLDERLRAVHDGTLVHVAGP